jgi:HSP90 family molecular chaperone
VKKIKIEDFFSAQNHKLIVRDIFAMYHLNWDVIGESVQNAVDSVLKRREEASEDYVPSINITYETRVREIVVKDNGIGIPAEVVRRIITPRVSLKTHKVQTVVNLV